MYGSQAEFQTYCTERAYDVLSFDAAAQTAALFRASLFVDGLGYKDTGTVRTPLWPGTPTVPLQEREWPRENANDIYGNELASDTVPTRIEHATYEVAFFDLSGGDINRALASDQVVTREKFDVIEFQYASAEGKMIDTRPIMPAVQDLLAPLMVDGTRSAAFGITLVTSG